QVVRPISIGTDRPQDPEKQGFEAGGRPGSTDPVPSRGYYEQTHTTSGVHAYGAGARVHVAGATIVLSSMDRTLARSHFAAEIIHGRIDLAGLALRCRLSRIRAPRTLTATPFAACGIPFAICHKQTRAGRSAARSCRLCSGAM